MGYMGLSHWVESDKAADFRSALQKIPKTNIRNSVLNELIRDNGPYNTNGLFNVCLVLEDEGNFDEDPSNITPIISEHLTKDDFDCIHGMLEDELQLTIRAKWPSKESFLEHHNAIQRMIQKVKSFKD